MRTIGHLSTPERKRSTAGRQDWTKQKITFDTAYGNERMAAYLFLPRTARPPWHTVVFFPSARVLGIARSDTLGDLRFIDFVIKSGRAVMYPIYQGMYERQATVTAVPGPTLARDAMIEWSKDLGRSLDYLESRADIDRSRIG